MNVTIEKVTISLTGNELYILALCVDFKIKQAIESHWVNHQRSWRQHEQEGLNMARELFSHCGRTDLYEEILEFAEKKFREFNEKFPEKSQ